MRFYPVRVYVIQALIFRRFCIKSRKRSLKFNRRLLLSSCMSFWCEKVFEAYRDQFDRRFLATALSRKSRLLFESQVYIDPQMIGAIVVEGISRIASIILIVSHHVRGYPYNDLDRLNIF